MHKLPLPKSIIGFLRINLATLRGVSGISWYVQPLFNRLEERERIQTKRQQRMDSDQIITDYTTIINDDFNINTSFSEKERRSLIETIVDTTEQLKLNAYPIISDQVFSDYLPHHKNGIEALVFAREIEIRRAKNDRQDFTGEQITDFNTGVKNAIKTFDFHDPSHEEKEFLTLYNKFKRPIKGEAPEPSEEVIDLVPASPLEVNLSQRRLAELYNNFMMSYYPSESWAKYAEDEYIEYKNKIVELVQSQVSIGGVQSDVFAILDRERNQIREQLEAQEAYFVCSKQIADYDGSFQYDILPEKYARSIRIGNKYLNEPGQEEEPLEVKMRIIFPRKSYGSSSNFFNNSLSELVPDEELVYVSKLSMPFEHGGSEEEFFEMAESPDKVNYVLSKTDFLLRGRSEEEITRAAIDNLRMAEMDVSELLKSLTLRSIVDDATYREEEFFSEHKEKIEEGLDINDIFEWGEQDPDVIAELLRRWDEEGISDRWDIISERYINEIETATPPAHFQDLGYGEF